MKSLSAEEVKVIFRGIVKQGLTHVAKLDKAGQLVIHMYDVEKVSVPVGMTVEYGPEGLARVFTGLYQWNDGTARDVSQN